MRVVVVVVIIIIIYLIYIIKRRRVMLSTVSILPTVVSLTNLTWQMKLYLFHYYCYYSYYNAFTTFTVYGCFLDFFLYLMNKWQYQSKQTSFLSYHIVFKSASPCVSLSSTLCDDTFNLTKDNGKTSKTPWFHSRTRCLAHSWVTRSNRIIYFNFNQLSTLKLIVERKPTGGL